MRRTLKRAAHWLEDLGIALYWSFGRSDLPGEVVCKLGRKRGVALIAPGRILFAPKVKGPRWLRYPDMAHPVRYEVDHIEYGSTDCVIHVAGERIEWQLRDSYIAPWAVSVVRLPRNTLDPPAPPMPPRPSN